MLRPKSEVVDCGTVSMVQMKAVIAKLNLLKSYSDFIVHLKRQFSGLLLISIQRDMAFYWEDIIFKIGLDLLESSVLLSLLIILASFNCLNTKRKCVTMCSTHPCQTIFDENCSNRALILTLTFRYTFTYK